MLELTYPDHFPAFVAELIRSGIPASEVQYLLEKPWKWTEEFNEFVAQKEAVSTSAMHEHMAEERGRQRRDER